MFLLVPYLTLVGIACWLTLIIFSGDWKSDLLAANAIVCVDLGLAIMAYPVALTVIY